MGNSRLAGFYKLNLEERLAQVASASGLTPEELAAWTTGGINLEAADHMIENVVGLHSLALGIGLNFQINGRDVLVPMAIEEPSVVAGASFMAKLARTGGGFQTTSSAPLMIGQMQVLNITNLEEASFKLYEHKAELLAAADEIDPVLKKFGGGARDMEVRLFPASPIGGFLVLHLIYDVRDAMGANAVNTACERLAPQVEAITGGKVHLRILSNLADLRLAGVDGLALADDLREGRLLPVVLEDAEAEPLAIWAVYPTARMVPAKVRAFVAALESRLMQGPPD